MTVAELIKKLEVIEVKEAEVRIITEEYTLAISIVRDRSYNINPQVFLEGAS